MREGSPSETWPTSESNPLVRLGEVDAAVHMLCFVSAIEAWCSGDGGDAVAHESNPMGHSSVDRSES